MCSCVGQQWQQLLRTGVAAPHYCAGHAARNTCWSWPSAAFNGRLRSCCCRPDPAHGCTLLQLAEQLATVVSSFVLFLFYSCITIDSCLHSGSAWTRSSMWCRGVVALHDSYFNISEVTKAEWSASWLSAHSHTGHLRLFTSHASTCSGAPALQCMWHSYMEVSRLALVLL